MRAKVICSNMTFDNPHQLPRRVKHADRVRKSGVCSARKDQLGESELSNSAQTLEWPGLDNLPKCPLELIRPEFDQIV